MIRAQVRGQAPIDFATELKTVQQKVEAELHQILEADAHLRPEGLHQAMAYGTLEGGKRLRPFLHMMSARLFGADETKALRMGCAVELIHCYSLMHDDLPCMDDSPLRRGKPSVHAAFGEATAVLAGSALVDLATEMLCAIDLEPARLLKVVATLARASGAVGMLGGQHLDLAAEKNASIALGLDEISHLQDLKTGALLTAPLEMAVHAFAPDDSSLEPLRIYGHHFGLAFQITDDLLDRVGSSEVMGKPIQRDANKTTFVTLLGVEGARQKAAALIDEACAALEIFGDSARILQEAAQSLLKRVS